jgi:predicted transposase YbfD/YdcC
LTFLGLLCRQVDFAASARWAKDHGSQLREPLGFTRRYAPHSTTWIRAAAGYSGAQFHAALAGWLAVVLTGDGPRVAAVEGKTSQQAFDPDGHPLHVLNVFAHEWKRLLAGWPTAGDKPTEPKVLKAHLDELFAAYPTLWVLTGDALFCQRPLARAILDAERDCLLGVQDNQPELHEAARTAFGVAASQTAAATAREKTRRGGNPAALAGRRRGRLGPRGMGFSRSAGAAARRLRDPLGGRCAVVTVESRYFAGSLDPARVSASRFLELVRGHWQIENSLHFVQDRWWDEDRHVCRRPGLAAGFTTLWSAALTVLRATGCAEAKGSMRGAADALSRNIGQKIGLLTGPTL